VGNIKNVKNVHHIFNVGEIIKTLKNVKNVEKIKNVKNVYYIYDCILGRLGIGCHCAILDSWLEHEINLMPGNYCYRLL
jgi:hypothetical protein